MLTAAAAPHFAALENIEFEANIDLYRAATEGARVAHAIEAHGIGATTCLTCRGIEPAAMFCRAVGVGVGRAASEAELDDVLAHMAAPGARFAITETGERLPDKPSASYRNILRAGFEEGYLRQNCVSPST